MDLSTLLWLAVAVWLLIDIPTGGLIAANVAGGGAAAGGAAWRSVAESAKASYAARTATLAETAIGRWRLKAEAKAFNLGLKCQAALAGLVRGGVRAVTEAAKAAPAGAANGRELRQRALAIASAKAASVAAAAKAKLATRTAESDPAPSAENATGVTPAPPTYAPDPADAVAAVDWSDVPPCKPGDDPIKCQNPKCTAGDGPHSPPAPRGSETEEQMSNLESAAEDRGVTPYLAAWDGETGMERIAGELSALAARMQAAVEANRRHDPDGAQDVIGKVQAAVAAALAVGEAIDGKAAALHTKWDTTLENAKATGADSATELVGAQ